MSPLRHAAVTGLLLLWLVPGRAAGFTGSDMLDMMRVMSAMMSLYNVFSGVGAYSALNPLAGAYANPLASAYLGQWSGLPGSSLPNTTPWGSVPDLPPPPNDLSMDGEWMSEDGGTLTFRGERFLLNNGRGEMMEGSFMINRDRLIAYIYPADQVLVFGFERRGEYFVVQDDQGQMMMFQRMPRWQSDPAGW